jgi:hypothetical protein
MKLWVDDERNPPDNSWTVARNYADAIFLIENTLLEEISLDHDLGDGKKNQQYGPRGVSYLTGYDIVCHIEKLIHFGGIIKVPKIFCHSSNPVGRARINSVIEKIGASNGDH